MVVAGLLSACATATAPDESETADAAAVLPIEHDGDWFVDRAAATGLDFVHANGMTGNFYQPEMMGPGVGLLDYDNDGDLDVYLVQGGRLGTARRFWPRPRTSRRATVSSATISKRDPAASAGCGSPT